MELIKACLIISLLGIFTLLILSNFLEPKPISISKISAQKINKQVKIKGQVISIQNYSKKFKGLLIKDSSSEITAVCNCKKINLNAGKNVTIIGKIGKYKEKLQIQAEIIKQNSNI